MTTHSAFARILSTILALSTLVTLASCGNKADATNASAQAAATVAVAVADVTSDSIASPVIATGTFGSRDEIPLAFKIGGVIARVDVDQGTMVRKGQLLASLDLREIDAMVDKARIGVEKAERDAARLRRLQVDSVATLAQLQDATSALDAARADYASARVNREYATIVAPEGGVVLQRQATPGTTISPGTPVLTIGGSIRGRVLRIGVTDRDVMRVRVGDRASVRFDAVPSTLYTGTVTLLGKAADPRTGTYTAEIQLRDAEKLPDGLVGRAEILVRATAIASMIPVDALLEADADSAVVYTTSRTAPFVAEPHRVRIADVQGDKAAVTGLPANARVITRGAPYVTAGTVVRITSGSASNSVSLAPRGGREP